jgi:exoribonuclease R
MDLEVAVLRLVSRPGYKPLKPRVMAQRLGLPKDRFAEVRRAVKRLVRRGQVHYGSNHLVQPMAAGGPGAARVVGVFQRTQKGYGFVRPTQPFALGGEAPAPPAAEPPADIYIPAKATRDASTGDVVLVALDRRRRGPPRPGALGPRGEVIEVLQRQTRQFVGTYFEEQGAAYVAVDGTLFAQPIARGEKRTA